jgi:hypothetical protein
MVRGVTYQMKWTSKSNPFLNSAGRVRLDYECTAQRGILPAYAHSSPQHLLRDARERRKKTGLSAQLSQLRHLSAERPAADAPMADLWQRSAYGPPQDDDDDGSSENDTLEDDDALTAQYAMVHATERAGCGQRSAVETECRCNPLHSLPIPFQAMRRNGIGIWRFTQSHWMSGQKSASTKRYRFFFCL